MADAVVPGRKILKQEGDVQMWQEDVVNPRRDHGRLIHYFVGTSRSAPKAFDKPHDAWEYFRQLTGVPEPKSNQGQLTRRRREG